MRSLSLLAVLASLTVVTTADGRLYWQTYDSTIATPSGSDWNHNQYHLVPQRCASCRYDLLSSCKGYPTTPPACKNLHPVYSGCDTAFVEYHYPRHAQVHSKHCDCTLLKRAYGACNLDCYRKHRFVRRPAARAYSGVQLTGHRTASPGMHESQGSMASPIVACKCWCNVNPLRVAILGSIAALPAGSGAKPAAMGSIGWATMLPVQLILPTLGIPPSMSASAAGALPRV